MRIMHISETTQITVQISPRTGSYRKASARPLDLCGPLPSSIDGSTYFITFTDDYSSYSWVYGIPNKKSSTIRVKFDEWIKDAHTKADKKVKYLRTDGGGEYIGFLTPLLSSYGQPTA